MNVAFDPWIPLVTISGKRELASLAAVFSEGERFADLAVRPHERVALMRLFTCVAHAALDGPKNYDDWCEVPEKLPEAALRYLTAWKDFFELFHRERPWLQVVGLKPAKENNPKSFTPIAKLDFALASGAASTLFDHPGCDNDSRSFDNSQLILGLLAIQNFSTCGLLSRPIWKGKACPNSAKDAPCVTSSMFHVFLVGKNLLESISINICDFGELSMHFNSTSSNDKWLGRPAWECMPTDATDDQATKTYLGRLTPVSRAIRFFPQSSYMLYGEALRYSSFPDFYREVNSSVIIKRIKKKEERYLVGARLGVRPWRQLDAILQYNLQGKTSTHAVNLGHLGNEPVDVWIGALLRNPGKQDVIDSIESRFHLSPTLRSMDGCAIYSHEIQNAQNIANKLSKAIYVYRIALDPRNETGIGEGATTHYWTSTEQNLPLLMAHIEAIDTDDAIPTRKNWRKMLYASAHDAYKLACGQETPRQRRAFAKGWQELAFKKNQSQTNNDKNMEGNP